MRLEQRANMGATKELRKTRNRRSSSPSGRHFSRICTQSSDLKTLPQHLSLHTPVCVPERAVGMYLDQLRHRVAREAYLQRSGTAQRVELEGVGAPWDLTNEKETNVQPCRAALDLSV